MECGLAFLFLVIVITFIFFGKNEPNITRKNTGLIESIEKMNDDSYRDCKKCKYREYYEKMNNDGRNQSSCISQKRPSEDFNGCHNKFCEEHGYRYDGGGGQYFSPPNTPQPPPSPLCGYHSPATSQRIPLPEEE